MFKPSNAHQTPGSVPVPSQGENDNELRPGDPIGAFTGYIRRPKSSSAGLTAQFFGQDGADADVIAAMHLTRFKDMTVKVKVWMMKNADGKIMGKNGDFPLMTEFMARLKNPRPSETGQTAQFFGENGPNSDAINILNQSEFQDSMVYVEIVKAEPGQLVSDIPTEAPTAALSEEVQRMTPRQVQELKKNQKKAGEAWRILQVGGFFRNEALWSVLGGEPGYREWLTSQPCSHPGDQPCPNEDIVPYAVPGIRRLGQISLCTEHVAQWEQGTVTTGAQAPLAFLTSTQVTQVQQWAQHRLKQVLAVPDSHYPMPGKLYAWATQHNLRNQIPSSFIGLLG